jgi:hypothetical protein
MMPESTREDVTRPADTLKGVDAVNKVDRRLTPSQLDTGQPALPGHDDAGPSQSTWNQWSSFNSRQLTVLEALCDRGWVISRPPVRRASAPAPGWSPRRLPEPSDRRLALQILW